MLVKDKRCVIIKLDSIDQLKVSFSDSRCFQMSWAAGEKSSNEAGTKASNVGLQSSAPPGNKILFLSGENFSHRLSLFSGDRLQVPS